MANLQDLLAAIGQGAIHAQDIASRASLEKWDRFFDTDGDGTLTPKERVFQLAEELQVSVPEILLTLPTYMRLSNLSVEFETQMDLDNDQVQISGKSGLFKNQTHVKINVGYELAEAPEMIEVLRDKYVEAVKKQIG